MSADELRLPNPRRVAAGRLNWKKRKGFTAAGLERLRQAAIANKPWLHTTGPRSTEGKARSAANSIRKSPQPVREILREAAEVKTLIKSLQAMTALLLEQQPEMYIR